VDELDIGELGERAGVTPSLARELEEFGLLAPRSENGTKLYGEGDVDVAATCAKLARYGISARHLRTFRTAADREAGLLEQIVSPALRSRNPERRQAGLDELQNLAELAQELSQLLFWRDLKQLADR
jgi:DNA-binding transcriptional MerR regulator